jgi:catalase
LEGAVASCLEEAMTRLKRRAEAPADDRERVASQTIRAFTADDGRRLAALAGEAQANRPGHPFRPGWRPVHTRGILLEGTFVPSGDAGPDAPAHLAGDQPLAVWARLSNCQADLEFSDDRSGPRGLAVRFRLPDGRSTDLLAMSVDRFPVTTLDAFVSVSKALRRRSWLTRYARLGCLVTMHQFRGPVTFMLAFPPSSYARCDYYAIHTFVWGSRTGRPVRYRWRSEVGRELRRPFRSWGRPPNYLEQDLTERLNRRREPIRFGLEIQEPTDVGPGRLRDVGRPLPRRVAWRRIGTLMLETVVDDGDTFGRRDRVLFSPAHLIEGVEPFPGDEIMAARTAAYPASHVARTGCGR